MIDQTTMISAKERPLQLLLAHPGTQHAPRLVAEMERRGLLQEFWSGFAYGDDAFWLRFVSEGLKARLRGRMCRNVPDRKVHCRPFLEWHALRRLRSGARREDVYYERNERFQRLIPQHAIARASAVIGFDTSSWILARRCRAVNVPFVLEQTVAHPLFKQRMLAEAANDYPDWADADQCRPARLLDAEKVEHEQADRIVVGSSFCRRTLLEEGVSPTKLIVNPYGVEPLGLPTVPIEKSNRNGPLRFVLLGFLSLRKGVPLLLDAWKKAGLRDAELVLAGGIRKEHLPLLPQTGNIRYEGPIPRGRVLQFLAEQDVNVLPSYSEGFAISLIEGLVAGLPLIASSNTGAPDFVSEGREGFVIPAGDIDSLVDRLRWFADNRDKLGAMSLAARQKAEEFTWERYGHRYEAMLRGLETSTVM